MSKIHNIYSRARLDDRQMSELLGLSAGIIADGKVSQHEAEFLQKWLVKNSDITDNPIINNLLIRVNEMLGDNFLDDDEAKELFETLSAFSGGEFELGEVQKSSTLPFNKPSPEITFADRIFCFTGTFAFGSRRECREAIESFGGFEGRLTKKTDYLVIGIYATDSWKYSSYGAKIDKAVGMRKSVDDIAIIGEEHWIDCLSKQ